MGKNAILLLLLMNSTSLHTENKSRDIEKWEVEIDVMPVALESDPNYHYLVLCVRQRDPLRVLHVQ
jgi:hypothetical protein